MITRWIAVLFLSLTVGVTLPGATAAADEGVAKLANEVRNKGWIMYCARSPKGDFDLFLMRPDGSDVRNITNTPKTYEGAARFSPDGRKILYRRFRKSTKIDRNKWGFQGSLIIANADGSNPVALGKDGRYPWASWSPDGKRIACLTRRGIQIVDLDTKKTVHRLSRKGIYQQLFWSPDGKWLCGVTNAFGQYWTIARMNAETGKINPVPQDQAAMKGSECTPDWFPDSEHIIFSHSPADQNGEGWTHLWMADGRGYNARLIYAEDGRHLYGGTLSPDAKYVLFMGVREQNQAGAFTTGTPIGILRFEDTPAMGGNSSDLRKMYPDAKDAPVLKLPAGYEPDWTYVDIRKAQNE